MIALLRSPGSRWLEDVASASKTEVCLLDLDAAMTNGSVTVTPESVIWQSIDLMRTRAVLVETPWFAWPHANIVTKANSTRGTAEREARALSLSALHAAAQKSRVMQPLHAAALAVAPLSALDLCADAGVPVRPWRMVVARPQTPATPWLDLVGRDACSTPRTPAVGEPAWTPDPFVEGVVSLLVVGDEVIGARRFADSAAWQDSRADGAVTNVDSHARDIARLARRSLGVDWLQVDLRDARDATQLLAAHVGPDLAAWDRERPGAVAEAFTKLLTQEAPSR